MFQEDCRYHEYVKLRLQFFAKEGPGGEKTEEPTAKKLSDARKEGQVARSQELVMAASLLALFLILKIFVGWIGKRLIAVFHVVYPMFEILTAEEEIGTVIMFSVLSDVIWDTIMILLPIFAAAILTAFAINVFQVKWQISLKPLQPKLNKFSPISGFKRLFSADKIFELLKSVAKIAIISVIAYTTLKDKLDVVFRLLDMDIGNAIVEIGDLVLNLGIKISAFYMVIGLGDYIYQKMKFKKEMMMTKQEIKDEYKQTEGDPQVKGRIKQKMREAARRRMMQRLPEADVVITNPTHFACALKYDKTQNDAPVLIAKGADYLAEKIKEVARENFVPIVENKPLARMLYYNVELEQEIPEELYQMAAEVLRYVYSLKAG